MADYYPQTISEINSALTAAAAAVQGGDPSTVWLPDTGGSALAVNDFEESFAGPTQRLRVVGNGRDRTALAMRWKTLCTLGAGVELDGFRMFVQDKAEWDGTHQSPFALDGGVVRVKDFQLDTGTGVTTGTKLFSVLGRTGPVQAYLLRCKAGDINVSGGDVFYGAAGTTHALSSFVISEDCEGFGSGSGGSDQCLTTHDGLAWYDIRGYYHSPNNIATIVASGTISGRFTTLELYGTRTTSQVRCTKAVRCRFSDVDTNASFLLKPLPNGVYVDNEFVITQSHVWAVVRFVDTGFAPGTILFAGNWRTGALAIARDIQIGSDFCDSGDAIVRLYNNRLGGFANNTNIQIYDQSGLTVTSRNNTDVGGVSVASGSGGTLDFDYDTFEQGFGTITPGANATVATPGYTSDVPTVGGNLDGTGDPSVDLGPHDGLDVFGRARRRSSTICRGPVEIQADDPGGRVGPHHSAGSFYPRVSQLMQAVADAAHLDSGADTVDDSVQDKLTDTLADTNEMQGDLANGGRLDLLIDAVVADVAGLAGDVMRGTDLAALATTALSNVTWTDAKAGYLTGAVALEATLTAIKGAGWSTETLAAIDALIDAIKAKTDGLNFTGDDVKATLDGEEVTPTTASKTDYALADGAITDDKFSPPTLTGPASGVVGMLVQLWRRKFKKAEKDASGKTIKTYADDGITVLTTQTISESATLESQEEAT